MIERIINDEIPVGPSFESYNDSTDFLSLHIDRIRVHVGNDVTGNVSSIGEPNTKVVVELEGTEYTVVALPGMSKDELDAVSAQDLKKETFQKRTFLRERKELMSNSSEGFRFGIPDTAPGTIRRTLDGTCSSLPSQCQIKYTMTAMIVDRGYGGQCHQESKFSKEILVLPKKEVDVPIDSSIAVSIGSKMEALHNTLLPWGKLQGAIDTICACGIPTFMETGASAEDNYIVLESSKDELNLCIGQTLLLEISDSFGLLTRQQRNAVWMFKLTEELSWEAQGRKTSNKETWNLHVNNHGIPNLIPSYDHNHESLIQVQHTLVVYMAAKDRPSECLASTGPIKVKIVSSRAGLEC